MILSRTVAAGLFLLAGLTAASGADAPDAGSLLRGIETSPRLEGLESMVPEIRLSPAVVPAGPAVRVREFHLRPAILADDELNRVLAGFGGRALSPAQLQQALDQLHHHLSTGGKSVALFIPRQMTGDGVIEITVQE